MSRFLAKVALEVLANQLSGISGALQEIVERKDFDIIRNYARIGVPNIVWPINIREIYPENHKFIDRDTGKVYEMLHEYKLLYTELQELYLVTVIFGIEYAINIAGPEIDGYIEWLKQHDSKSPLYMDNNFLLS